MKGTFKPEKYGAVRVQKNIKKDTTKEEVKEKEKREKEISIIKEIKSIKID